MMEKLATKFSEYLKAAELLDLINRPASARAVKEAAANRFLVEIDPTSKNESMIFNDFPTDISPKDAHASIIKLAQNLPKSNGASIPQKISLTVGIITDLYMYNFYKDVFDDLIYLTPENYQDKFSKHKFDIILYVSCWKGIDDEEWRGIKFREKPAEAFKGILNAGRYQGAKLIFQSIEDPSNFENFLPLAKQFDVIFTSDADSISAYKEACRHDAVFYAEYGANPLLQNPVGCRKHIFNASVFAGSWAARYAERCEDMQTIFASLLDCGSILKIIDRNFGVQAEELKYPLEYRDCVLPSVDHETLQSVHKLFRYNINLNSIKGSTTMCAMRVYELQAMGVGILSNYARSVFNKFPEVRLLPYKTDMSFDFNYYETFEEYESKMRRLRSIMSDRTAYNVTAKLLTDAGIIFSPHVMPVVAVICDDNNAASHKEAVAQTYSNVVITTRGEISSLNNWEALRRRHKIEYFTWFDPNCRYGSHYVQDNVNALKYTRSDFVTKHAWFSPDGYINGPQHEYTSKIAGRARTLFDANVFSPNELENLEFHEAGEYCNRVGYALDPFELYGNNTSLHPTSSSPYRLSVIVPVYNNGKFLINKCFESLRRNRIWNEMQVILVDDGSTDEETVSIVNKIAERYSNVKTYFYNDGGSGTASRARNKGILISESALVSFLDPDNEISAGGYDMLMSIYEDASYDDNVHFVAGYHVKVETRSTVIGKHSPKRVHKVNELKRHFLETGRFPVIPTQPAVISRKFLIENSLFFVEGAAGQDTLFGWELLCKAKTAIFTDAAHLIYYSQRAGSIVNGIDEKYFSKKLALEKVQVSFLKQEGLLEVYREKVFPRFMSGWYLPKLDLVQDPMAKERCEEILEDIKSLYH